MDYFDLFLNSYKSYATYLWNEIANPSWHNYFYWLLLVSFFFLMLEWSTPWRTAQPKFRKDFWLDFFYMFFNFFLFSLVIYNAASDVVVHFFNNIILNLTGFSLQNSNPMHNFPAWAVLLIGFLVRDFIQWWTHRLLHKVEWLWNFHKVHHSVEQMGFAAHLRYHWMENVVYRSIEYVPLALLGVGLHDFFVMHIFALSIGHYNHANISVKSSITGAILGGLIGVLIANSLLDIHLLPSDLSILSKIGVVLGGVLVGFYVFAPAMKYVFNSPEMHIWHHAYEMPRNMPNGINFGISLAIWDYIFGTAHIPYSGRDIRLGFPEIAHFPQDFVGQNKIF